MDNKTRTIDRRKGEAQMKKDYDFEEYCPYCEHINEIVWDGVSHTTICKNCGCKILLCSICEVEKCGDCPYEKELEL